MKWSEEIQFTRTPAEVALLKNAPVRDWMELLATEREEACARGRREAEAAMETRLAELRSQIAELRDGVIEQLSAAIPKLISDSEAFLVRLAIDAAERVVAATPIDAAMVEAVVRDALKQTRQEHAVTVQLHPEDLDLLRKDGSPLLTQAESAANISFSPNAEVGRGGCILLTDFGRIDARREIKWKQLRESVQPDL